MNHQFVTDYVTPEEFLKLSQEWEACERMINDPINPEEGRRAFNRSIEIESRLKLACFDFTEEGDVIVTKPFTFIDEADRPYRVMVMSYRNWLFYWNEGVRGWVTLREVTMQELPDLMKRMLPTEQAALYDQVAKSCNPLDGLRVNQQPEQ